MEKNSFIFYRTYYDAIQKLPKAKRLGFFDALCRYALDEETPDFKDPTLDIMFGLMKGNLDSCDKRYYTSAENGKKGGRPRKNAMKTDGENLNQKPNYYPNRNLTKPNENLNYNKNVDDNVNSSSTFVDDRTSSPFGSKPTPNPSDAELAEIYAESLRKLQEGGEREEAEKEKERERLFEEGQKIRQQEREKREQQKRKLTQGGEVSES